ncbi:ketoacyl-ACP synthase III [Streptomyces sp. 5-6(2022)]|uniref:3-oxoacyl-ACP synthase III family protein n=1 Tax=Streptomyces sp. 5-6(2022) TaxID=2936510 RepID=UPI0023B8A59B|nr:ketoacyl-ACP synthase III [Streptomyces sp. 5-6(2022)]
MAVGIGATGRYLPPRVIDNVHVTARTHKSAEWVRERTGFEARRWADEATATSDLGYAAVADLLDTAPGALDEGLGAIIFATSTPDQPMPSTAAALQDQLKADGVPSFDIGAVCAGSLYALIVGAALAERPGTGPKVLVVAGDKYSPLLDVADPTTVSLFGDGAAAILLTPVPDGYGLLSSKLVAHGSRRGLVEVIGGGSRRPLTAERLAAGEHLFRMKGRAVRDYVLETVPGAIKETLDAAGVDVQDIDRWIPHQANLNLLRELAGELGADPDRFAMTPRFGNTGCASLPIALCESRRNRPFGNGELHCLFAVGGGMAAAVAVMRHWESEGTVS